MSYSRKRRRADGSLTGGTGDVNPQWMSFHTAQSANDTGTGGSVQPPVSLSTGENLAMEILRIYVRGPSPGTQANEGVTWWLSTKNFGATAPALGLGDATTVMLDGFTSNLLTSGSQSANFVRMYDMTDGDGHGVLVGNQNLYWGINSFSTANTNTVDWKILYRAKRISDSELLGIVLQSNQN